MPILHFVLDKGFATHCMFTFLLIITAVLLPDTDSRPFSYVIVILSTCQQL